MAIHFAHKSAMPVTASHLTPAFRRLVHRLDDPEEFSVAVSGAALRAEFLGRQAQPTRIEQFQSLGWVIDFHEAHVRARILGSLPACWASLGIMCSPAPSTWYGLNSPQGTIVCTPPGEMIDGCTVPIFSCVSLGLSPPLWERCRQIAAPALSGFGGCAAHKLPADGFAGLQRKMLEVRRSLRQAATTPRLAWQAAAEAARFVTEVGVAAWELQGRAAPFRDSPRNRARLVRRSEAWLREHIDRAIRIPDLCLALRVSRRELEYAFRHTLDLSPQEYLRKLRLNAIHRELHRPGAMARPLLEIALQHGVTHPGRFAAHYRELFGQRPRDMRRGGN